MITALWAVTGVVAYVAVGLLSAKAVYRLSRRYWGHSEGEALAWAWLYVAAWPLFVVFDLFVEGLPRLWRRRPRLRLARPIRWVDRFITGGEGEDQ